MRANLRFLRNIVVFRLVSYLWKYHNFYSKLHRYEFSYKFDTVLCQFLETGTSVRMSYMYRLTPMISGFIRYPLSFLYSPLKILIDCSFGRDEFEYRRFKNYKIATTRNVTKFLQ